MAGKLKQYILLISVTGKVERLVEAESPEAAKAVFDSQDYMVELDELANDWCEVVNVTEVNEDGNAVETEDSANHSVQKEEKSERSTVGERP